MSELYRRLDNIKEHWDDTGARWNYEDFPGDLQLVRDAVAGKVGGKPEQKLARRMLYRYYEARGEFDRAEELLYILLDAVDSDCERVEYRENLFDLRHAKEEGTGEETWRQDYETYARLCFEGIEEKKDGFIASFVLRAGSGAVRMGDHALLAAAAYLKSFQETNVVDQLAVEARYKKELEQFQATPAHLLDSPQGRYRQECLDRLDKMELRKRCDPEMRWIYLALRWAVEQDVTGMNYPRDIRGAWAWANKLARRARDFHEAYPDDVLSISKEGVNAYMELARRYMRALELGNPAVAQSVMEHPEVFEKMLDYTIPAAACMIWATHEENKDPEARRRAGEEGKQWLDVLLGTRVDPNGAPSCFRKWAQPKPGQLQVGMQTMQTRMQWRQFLYRITGQVAQEYPQDWLD